MNLKQNENTLKRGRKNRLSRIGTEYIFNGKPTEIFTLLYLFGPLSTANLFRITAWLNQNKDKELDEKSITKRQTKPKNNSNLRAIINELEKKEYIKREKGFERKISFRDGHIYFKPDSSSVKESFIPTTKWLIDFCNEKKIFPETTQLHETFFNFIEKLLRNNFIFNFNYFYNNSLSKKNIKLYCNNVFVIIQPIFEEYLMLILDLEKMFGNLPRFWGNFEKEFRKSNSQFAQFDEKTFFNFIWNYPKNETQEIFLKNFLSRYYSPTGIFSIEQIKDIYETLCIPSAFSGTYPLSLIVDKINLFKGRGNSGWVYRMNSIQGMEVSDSLTRSILQSIN